MRVLVVEDHDELVANIVEFLSRRDIETDVAFAGPIGLELASGGGYDAIVLDIGLPGIDGLELCRRLRASGRETPVLMLTARDGVEDTLAGFESGADDYLVKPFDLRELEARLRALAHRRERVRAQVLEVADLRLDPSTLRVTRSESEIRLSPIALRLLEHLMRESPRVVLRRELERLVWGDEPPDSDALRSHLHALRRAIDRPFDRPLLHTIHGIGYRLAADRETPG